MDILYWFEMPGACKKSSSCLHAQYLKKLVEQYGGIEMLMSWARPAGDSRNPISVSSTHGILPRTVFCVFHHCSEIYYFSDGQQQGEEDQPGEQEGEEFVTKLCKLKLRHVIEHADLVQVCRFEDVRNPPGFLVKGNCWTCRNSRNRCYHTRVYNKHCGQPGVTTNANINARKMQEQAYNHNRMHTYTPVMHFGTCMFEHNSTIHLYWSQTH